MTKQNLLDSYCDFTRNVVKDLLFPVEMQEDDEAQPLPRSPKVYDHDLPEFSELVKKAPFIVHQVITANDVWPEGEKEPVSKAVVRTVFGIYHPGSQEGKRCLLGLIEHLRLALWQRRVIGRQFRLDVKAGTEYLIYDKQPSPFYAGEMLTTWLLPSVKLEVQYGKQGYSNIQTGGPGLHSSGCPESGRHYGSPTPQE